MRFCRNLFLVAVLSLSSVGVFGVFISVPSVANPPHEQGGLPSEGPFRIKQVLDGDTIVLSNGEAVRLIGVDAPEINHPGIPAQTFGKESKECLRRLAEGHDCTLEYEAGNLRDKYGRLLAYVFVEGKLLNAELIRRGYAYAHRRFPFQRQAEFLALEAKARKTRSGLWNQSLPGQPSETLRILSWREADQYYGQYATVEGIVVATHHSGKACYLNFHPDYKRYFTALVFASAFSRFPTKPENYYHGKKVRVSGLIKEYQGRPEIILIDPSQIEVVK